MPQIGRVEVLLKLGQTAIRAKSDIFEVDITYNEVFPGTIKIGHVFAVQSLGWAYDEVKQGLKSKAATGSLTAIEERQLKLLEYPASKQFVIRIMGGLREELSGRRMQSAQEFVLRGSAITADGSQAVKAWEKAIRALLPSLVQGLPAEEYQVVRSTEHTLHVLERVQGIVAGSPDLQESFVDLRELLTTSP